MPCCFTVNEYNVETNRVFSMLRKESQYWAPPCICQKSAPGFHADTMPVASVRLACIRIAFDARIVAKHIRVAFEAPRAHDDASLRTVRFAARHNARHFAR